MEEIKLSDLQKPNIQVPQRRPQDFFEPSDAFNSIRNNTTIEDTIKAQPEIAQNQSIAQKIQTLTDKSNQFDLINNRISNLEQDIAKEQSGAGITRLGRSAELATRGRELDAQRQSVLSEIEALRGNIQTSESLRNSASNLDASTRTTADSARLKTLQALEGEIPAPVLSSLRAASPKQFADIIKSFEDGNFTDDGALTEASLVEQKIFNVFKEQERLFKRSDEFNPIADRLFGGQSEEEDLDDFDGGFDFSSQFEPTTIDQVTPQQLEDGSFNTDFPLE